MADVLAAAAWPTNGELIADVARLGYITDDDLVLDATYGRGLFWTHYRPPRLVGLDINTTADVRGDNRYPPFRRGAFDVVVLDPPYKLNGTPALGEFDDRYGTDTPMRWQERMDRIDEAILATGRLLKVGGRLLLKCQDQVCSGAVRWQTDAFTEMAAIAHLAKIDRFDMLGGGRPQPPGRRQVHARGRPSTLLVFRRTTTDRATTAHPTRQHEQ